MEFKYLGWVLTIYDYEWKDVIVNLLEALRRWERFFKILGQERSEPRTSGTFYRAAVQATLLFFSETWVITPRIGMNLRGFYHCVAHQLMRVVMKVAHIWRR